MADLINRQEAIDLWDKYHPFIAIKAMEYDGALRALPSVEPELKHGKWIERWHDNKHVVGDMACSVCGAQMLLTFPKFCPNCGAKMDESVKINYHVNFKNCGSKMDEDTKLDKKG